MKKRRALTVVGSTTAGAVASFALLALGHAAIGAVSDSPEKKEPVVPVYTSMPPGSPDFWTPERMADVAPDPYR
ncbi:hypothetical protein [Yinghuangia sp. YIM S09857]|uniref:hypothetical protein n=1 Tax=Yinghuangia sp. YIM S09857 TaxID=3436929 RepID=UPI003F532063